MPRRTSRGTIAALLLALIMALQTSQAQAAVDNLRSAILPTAEVPPDFAHPHIKVYTHFVPKMEVVTSMSGLQSTSDCILSAALARDGWTQGLIESFDRSKTTLSLQLCASLFKTSHGAHLAYRKIAGQEITLPVKRNLGARISLSGVGNEAAGIDRGGIHCACGSTDASGYEIVFRHDNAVLDLTYAGPTSLTLSQFEQLVTRTNQRLH